MTVNADALVDFVIIITYILYYDTYAKVNSFRKNIQIRNDEFESVHLHLKFLFQMNV